MRFAEVVWTSLAVTDERRRLEKVRRLAALLERLGTAEIEPVVAYLSGELPQGRIGVGPASLRQALSGAAAEATLEVADVDAELTRIAQVSGAGANRERQRRLAELLARATEAEQRFLMRLIAGELRQGAQEGIMVEAIARAARLPPGLVRRAVMLCGRAGAVARSALSEGEQGLLGYRIQLFRPLDPMLARTAEGVEDALGQLGEALLQYKLDGARIQVHRRGDEVRVFSRRGNDVTDSLPEVVEHARSLPVAQFVLDGEAIALRPDGAPHPFQTTMRRFGRRLDVSALRAELPLTPLYFDCLHWDGHDLIDAGTLDRLAQLEPLLAPSERVERAIVDDPKQASAFLERALKEGHEGVLAKALTAPYEAGRRGSSWLKLKPAHSLDLVVLAAEWGSGRRSGFLSNLHLGARDPATGGFIMLGKTFKGMTDALLKWQTEKFLQLRVAEDAHTVYLRPEIVVEVAFDGVQTSPHYPGGVALRFARVKRYRADKAPEQADTIETVLAIHARGLASGAS